MKQGDFTQLAKAYVNRPGYSSTVLRTILNDILATKGLTKEKIVVADVGAGTGKLTENLLELGVSLTAVEPNDAMREEGIVTTKGRAAQWKKGSGEETTLATNSTHWLLMGSSFHWVDLQKGLAEFHRVLKPGGVFTAIWNPRDLERSEFHMGIEQKIKKIVPTLTRVSSGGKTYTEDLPKKLLSTKQFSDVIFLEAEHEVVMSKERYIGAWRSVNDIQAQAGAARFEQIIEMISNEIAPLPEVVVPYKTRAWCATRG